MLDDNTSFNENIICDEKTADEIQKYIDQVNQLKTELDVERSKYDALKKLVDSPPKSPPKSPQKSPQKPLNNNNILVVNSSEWDEPTSADETDLLIKDIHVNGIPRKRCICCGLNLW